MKTMFQKLVNGCKLKLIMGRCGFFVVLTNRLGLILTQVSLATQKAAAQYFVKLDIFTRQLAH